MNDSGPAPSARRTELIESAYAFALEHGMGDLSLRPLARAIGSSASVLIYLFGSKDDLVRALLTRARADELAFIDRLTADQGDHDLPRTVVRTWTWLTDPAHRGVLTLWAEAYSRSLLDPDGPWSDFARSTVDDWLRLLAAAQPPRRRRTQAGLAERTLALAVLRGCLLDLLATGDVVRTGSAVRRYLDLIAR